MATVEERLAFLEGRVMEHGGKFLGLHEDIVALGERLDGRITSLEERLDGRITSLETHMNERFLAMEQRMDRRFEVVDQRFEAMDRRFEAVDQRFDALDQKFDRRFVWLIGTQVMTLVSVLGAFSAIVVALFD